MRTRTGLVAALILAMGCAPKASLRVPETPADLGTDPGEALDEIEIDADGPEAHAVPHVYALGAPPPGGAATGELAIHFLNVRQGDATLIACPNGKRILVDAGTLPFPEEPADEDGFDLVRYVRRDLMDLLDPDDPHIDTLLISHPDQDHYNLLPKVLRGIRFDQMVLIGEEREYVNEDHSKPPRRHNAARWLRRIRRDFPGKVHVLQRPAGRAIHDAPAEPSSLFDCGDANVWIVAAEVQESDFPTEPKLSPRNTRSVVLKVTYGTFDAILTGDATFRTEEAMMAEYDDAFLNAAVLKIGHHGSSTTSTSKEWADHVQPELAVASAGRYSLHEHPRRAPIARLEPHVSRADPHWLRWFEKNDGPATDDRDYPNAIFSTATNGQISVYSDGTNWWYDHD